MSAGAEAFGLVQQIPDIDLLFTDIGLPKGMNGRQLAEASLALHPGLKALFTSGYSESATFDEGSLASIGDLVPKPFRRHELAAAVRRTLDA